MKEINKPREVDKQSMRSGHRLGHGLTTERWLAGWNCRRWLGLLVFMVGLGSWNEAAGDSRGYVKVEFRLEAAFSGDPGDYGYLSAQINDVSAIIGITLTNHGGTSGFTNDWTTVRVPLSSFDETNDVPILATHGRTWRTSRIYLEPPSCYAIYPEYLGGYFLGYDTGSSTNYFRVYGDSGALFITIDGVSEGEIPRLAADGVSRITARLSGASSTNVTWSWVTNAPGCRLEPQPGGATAILTAGDKAGVATLRAAEGACESEIDIELIECGGCADCDSFGSGSVQNRGGPDFRLILGHNDDERESGYLALQAWAPSFLLAHPSSLVMPLSRTNNEVIRDQAGVIRQVRSLEGLVDAVMVTTNRLDLKLYYAADLIGKSNGLYVLTNTPFATWTLENPGGASSSNQLDITESGSDRPTRTYEFTHDGPSGKWALTVNDTLAQFVSWSVSAGTNRTDYAETWNGSNRVARTAGVYFTNGTDVLLGQLIQGESPNALTNTYTYYPASSRVRQIDEPDGRWQIFHYDAQGRVTHQFEPWTNSAPTTNAAGCRVTEYGYSLAAAGDDGVYQPELPRQTVVKIQGQEVRRRYTALMLDADGRLEGRIDKECPNPGAGWADASNDVTATDYLTEGEFRGRVWRRGHPDGTWTFLSYSQGATNFTTTETTGQANGSTNGIVNGTLTVTTLGSAGQVLSRCVTNVADGTPGLVLEREVYTYTDALNRSYRVVTLDGRTNQVQRGCCGTDTFSDKDGSTVTHAYDGLKRMVARTQHGITETNQLDGAGRVLARASLGANGVSIERERNGYDEVGRWMARTNALGGVTVWAEGMTNDYTRRLKITTDEGGGQRIEWYCRDGRLEKVTGSAAAPVVYEYGWGSLDGYAREYRKETALDANGQKTGQWTKTYFDGLGREIKTVYADETTGTETDNPASQRVYNAHGQLAREVDPDGVTTLYEYDGQGQWLRRATDLDRDGTMDLDGSDRITTTVRDVVNYGYVPVVRTRTYAHTANDSSQTGLVSTVMISTDGLTRWSIMPVEGGGEAVTLAVTSYGAGGQRSETTTEPDGSTWERAFSFGRLASVTRKDATNAQLSQVTYGYDAHGRVNTVTDARNGTTAYGYNAADRVTSVTTPPPGTGQPSQTTATEYNTLLQATKITHPDGTTTTSEYHPTGALKQTAGSRAYPVGYGYDAQGRLTTMTNWTAFSTGAGARVTTWNYDAQRGWLASKRDAEDKGPSYTYTPGGRLKTRAWARGVVMTNTYGFDDATANNDFADLVQVTYTGGSNTVTQAYDRRGRVTSVVLNGMTTAFSYNDAGLLTGESYSSGTLGGLMVTNSYDSCLRRAGFGAKVTGGANLVTNQFAYDAGSRLSSVTDGTNSAAYGYHTNSSLISQTTFKQNSTTRLTTWRSYDRLNRLTGVSSIPAGANQLPLSYQYSYSDANQRIRVGLHDGSYWLYDYDAVGQVKSGKRYWADGTPVAGQQFEYAHDDIGNRTETKAGGDSTGGNLRTAEYGANSLNQHTNRTVPGYVDVLGIGTAAAAVTVNGAGAYRRGEYFHVALAVDNSSAAQYPSIVIQAVAGANSASSTGSVFLARTPETFVHDADGNLTQDGRWTYTWDGENRLVTMEAQSAVPAAAKLRVEFEYDWRGRRIGKTVKSWSGTNYTNAYVLKFLYDGWNLVAELDANNVLVRSYLWGTDMSGSDQGAGGAGGLLAVNVATNGVHFPAYDGNGNIAGLVSAASSAITSRFEYGPFAEPIRVSGLVAKVMPLRFSTKYLDEETGLYYYGYRYYDPSTGRWANRDPIGLKGGINLYSFVRNRPTCLIDRLGKKDCEPCGEDVTGSLFKTLSDISYYYQNWSSDKRLNACKWIIGEGPRGLEGAKGAWSITQLACAGFGDKSMDVGTCRSYATVTFESECYFATAVNYAMWGRIMRLCHDSAQQNPDDFEGIPPERWSLLSAETLMTAWLLWNDKFLPGHEVWNQKAAFTRYGYSGISPKWSAPKDCGKPSSNARRHQFDWWWHPAARWDDPGLWW